MPAAIKKIDLVRRNATKTVAEITAITGIKSLQVYRYLRKLGIAPVKSNKIQLPSADELRGEGLTQKELAKKYSVSIGTIKRRLKRNEERDD